MENETTEKSFRKNDLLNLEYILKFNRWILKPIGAWPTSNKSTINFIATKILNIIVIGMICFIVIPCVVFVILEVTDTYERLRFAGPLIFFIIAMLKYLSLIFHEKDIIYCVDKMKEDLKRFINSSTEEKYIMLRYINFGRRIIIVCSFFMYGGAMFFYLIVPLQTGRILDVTTNDSYLRLVYPQPEISIIHIQKTPTNEIFFFLQCASGFLVHTITVASCSWAAVLAMHTCGQFHILKIMLNHLVDGHAVEANDVHRRFSEIVKQHVRILKFIARTQKFLKEISFVEIIGCTLDLCLLEYYFIWEWHEKEPIKIITFLILWVSLTFNIFIFCYIGELLSDQCRSMGECAYMIEWYRLPRGTSYGLVLSIAMSNSTRKLSAGNFLELSISSFGKIMKTSFLYLNLLRTVTDV